MNINIQVDKSLFGGGNSQNNSSPIQQNNNSVSQGGIPMINVNTPQQQQNSNGNSLQIGSNNSGGEMMSRMNSGQQAYQQKRITQNMYPGGNNQGGQSSTVGLGIPQFGGNSGQQRSQGSSNYTINQLPPRPNNNSIQPSASNIQNTNNNPGMLGVKQSNLLGGGSSLALPTLTSHRSVAMNQYDTQQQYIIPSSRQLLNNEQSNNQHMTLNIPFDDILGANEDFEQHDDEILNEFHNADSNELRNGHLERQSLAPSKLNSNLISYSINAQTVQNEGTADRKNGGVVDIVGRRNMKQMMNQENGSFRALTNPNGMQAEQYSVNVTITKVGNNIFQSKIDITKQMITDEFEEQKILDEQEMQQIISHNKFEFNNGGQQSRTSSQNSHYLKKMQGTLTQQPIQLALPDSNSLNNAQPQDGDNPHSLRKSTTNENLVDVYPELDSTMKKYDPRSLYIFNIHWKIRQLLIELMIWKYYEYFMMLTIFGNSLCLALNDYQDDNNLSEWNQTLQKIDQIFTVIYASECAFKILAFGLVFHKRAYLRDSWNVLDFVIVITGLITLIPNVPNLKSLRIMRVLRPLRSIHAVPSMKRQVRTLILSLPQMGYVASLLLFFICVFAILGLQLFARDLYNRCRLTQEPILGIDGQQSWPIDPTQQRSCGGLYTCNNGTYCHSLREKGIPLSVDKVEQWEFMFWGFLTFDNIGVSILSIFRVITLEDWSYVMYNYMDSSGIIAAIYFPLLVVLGGFFLLNLFLAVIMESFADMSSRPVQDPENEMMMDSIDTEDGNNTLNSSLEKSELQKMLEDEEITRMIAVTKKRMEMLHKGPMSLQDAAVMMVEQKRKIAKDLPAPPAITTIDQKFPELNPVHEMDEVYDSPDQRRKSIMSFGDQKIGQITHVKEGDAPFETDPLNNFQESPRLTKGMQRTDDANLVTVQRTRSICSKFSQCVLNFCETSFFSAFINLSIILNTICLGLDAYPPNEDIQSTLDVINIVFFGIFFAEMIIKNFGMGPRLYIKDPFNIFDAVIVMLSIIDVIVTYALPGQDNTSKGPITAFRAFRLLRVFKLSKSWKKLHYLLSTIGRALREISSFSVLLFLLVFIYVLLGMELFAKRNNDTKSNSMSIEDYVPEPRLNFDNFFNGFILIFTILTGESWDVTMLQFATSHGFYAIYFFMSFIIIGVMIFLNLFLAILLENFDEEEKEEEDNELANLSFSQKAQHYTIQFYNTLRSSFNGFSGKKVPDEAKDDIQGTEEQMNPTQLDTIVEGRNQKRNIQKMSSIVTFQNEEDQARADLENHENTINLDTQNQLDQAINIGLTSDIGNETVVKRQAGSDMNVFHGKSSLKKATSKHEGHKQQRGASKITNPLQDEFIANQLNSNRQRDLDIDNPKIDSNLSQGIILDGENNHVTRKDSLVLSYQDEMALDNRESEEVKIKDELLRADDEEDIDNEIDKYELEAENLHARNGFIKHSMTRRTGIVPSSGEHSGANIKKAYTFNTQQVPTFHNNDEFDRESEDFDGSNKKLSKQNTKSIAVIMKQKVYQQNIAHQNMSQYANYCEGNSLIFLGPFNPFRVGVMTLIKTSSFEGFILLLITIQSVLLALDNPLNDPDGFMVTFLRYSDIVFSSIFAVEAVLKIIAYGFLFNRDVAYLKNGWNIIDMFVVIISLVSINVSNKLKIIKIFRMFRVLRPLRVISRNKGLRIGIQALFMAVPSIISVLIVSLLFYIIFGIIGINYFKGALYECRFGDEIPIFLQPPPLFSKLITDKWSCLGYGGEWVNYDYHFNNLPEAVSTFFQMSTTEGWVDVMFHGIDSVDIDMQPVLNYNIYWSLFFMVFVFFGNFLILDLFTGVVVQTFNKEKEILAKNFLLSDNQKKWIEQKKICMQIKPKILEGKKYSPCRQSIRNLVLSKRFEVFTLVCIFLNSCVLAINWYDQSSKVDDILNYINYGFAIIFTLEAILKLIALGCRTYFRNGGNIFDIVIVVTSIISSAVSLLLKIDFGASTTFIRALRISRVLKFVQKAKQIRVILDTFTFVLPALTNIGGLLVLFLYIFSILGVFLFSQVKLQYWMDEHANFQSFGSAFLTLLRCSTGEAWNSIMVDAMRQNQILFQCSDDYDYQTYVENGYQTYGCGSSASGLIFFMTFMLVVPLIFLDLFIAIILEGFEQMSQNVNIIIPEFELQKFRDCWAEFDKDGTGFIAVADFPEFMLMLDDPIGWNPKIYQTNQRLQDDFLEELNVKTYDEFRNYLFWEVLQGLTKMYIIKMDLLRRIEKAEEILAKKKFINGEEADEEKSDKDDLNNPVTLHEQKLQLRLELEFETLDDERMDAMDAEEVKIQEISVMKAYLHRQDESYTSAHIKAGRKILEALKGLINKRNVVSNTIGLGGTIQKITVSTNDKAEAQNLFYNTSNFSEEFKGTPGQSNSKKSFTPTPAITINNGRFIFRNNNLNKQQSINTSDEMTILDGEVDFADGGTGAKKVVRRQELMTPMQNVRPITQSIIGQVSNVTPGIRAGTTGSPMDIMMNDFDIDNVETSSPDINAAERQNNKRDRALALLRQQVQDQSIYVDLQHPSCLEQEETKNVRNDWNDVPANMQQVRRNQVTVLETSTPFSAASASNASPQIRKSPRRPPPMIVLNSSNGFDEFREQDIADNTFEYNLNLFAGVKPQSGQDINGRHSKGESQNTRNGTSMGGRIIASAMLGAIQERQSVDQHQSFEDELNE